MSKIIPNIELKIESQIPDYPQPKESKSWSRQNLKEKIGTIFHLLGTKEGWDKIKADYADGKLNGRISSSGVYSNGEPWGGSTSIFTREI